MLIKSLFNLETNSTANLPNEYFTMLEKQQRHNEAVRKLQKLNQYNKNLIDCLSTIKITLVSLVQDFFKPPEGSFIKKVEQVILKEYQSLERFCLDMYRKIQKKLENYQNQILSLNKQYKQQLQQVSHYRRKVDGIKKGAISSRQQKQRLKRNIEKKSFIEEQCKDTQNKLMENYENFYTESSQYFKHRPYDMLKNFIKGHIFIAAKLAACLEQQKPRSRRNRRLSCVGSVISEISDYSQDAISEDQLEDQRWKKTPLQEIIIQDEPQDNLQENHKDKKFKNVKHQETSDGNNTFTVNIHESKEDHRKNSKLKTFMRKSSIQNKLFNYNDLAEQFQRALQAQIQHPIKSLQSYIDIQKAFEKIQAPMRHSQKLRQVFANIKHKFSVFDTNPRVKTQNLLDQDHLKSKQPQNCHQKSLLFASSEFKTQHQQINKKKHNQHRDFNVKKQFTLRDSDQERDLPSLNSKNASNSPSFSSSMSNNNRTSIQQTSFESKQKAIHLRQREITFNPNLDLIEFAKDNFDELKNNQKTVQKKKEDKALNFQQKFKNFKPNIHKNTSSELKSATSLNFLSTPSFEFNTSQRPQNYNTQKKQKKILDEHSKKKVIEHLFSVSGADTAKKQKNCHFKLNDINLLNKKQINFGSKNKKQPEKIESNHIFTTSFIPETIPIYLQTNLIQFSNQEKKVHRKKLQQFTTTAQNSQKSDKMIDFSIFQKLF